jgi:hypothetical protein
LSSLQDFDFRWRVEESWIGAARLMEEDVALDRVDMNFLRA